MSEGTIILRPLEAGDSAQIVAWRNQDWVRCHYIYREDFTLEGQLAYFHKKVETGEVAQYLVLSAETGQPIGCTVLSELDREHGTAEFGMFLGEKSALGKGYGRKMAEKTLALAFSELGLHTVCCRIFADNLPSVRGCLRAGFVKDHVIPGVRCTDGTVGDMYYLVARKRAADECSE
ncbi:MAG: GNAT family N-acetyltransferase [Firmicutes bacterium]|jgi:RimJ/RimL family protein N-acetyltransferase|nr:GNAT family N-acetyltransferase [Bacillota bacterium]